MTPRQMRAAAIVATLWLVACDGRTPLAPDVSTLSLAVVSGDGQVALVNAELPAPLVVKVVDSKGKGVKQQLVNFRVTAGGGQMYAGAAITDSEGIARDYWILGPVVGQQTARVVAVDPSTGAKQEFGTFSATALAPPPVAFLRGHGVVGGTGPSPVLPGIEIGGANRLLICAVATEPYYASNPLSAVVLDDGSGQGAQPLTQLGEYYWSPPDGLQWSTWYVVGATPGFGRRVSGTLATPSNWSIACESYTGVDQTNPFGPVSVAVGTSGTAALSVISNSDGSVAWGHLFSSNAGYVAGTGVTDRQKSSPHSGTYVFSYLVDGNNRVRSGGSHAFTWSYAGTWGGQGAMIRPAVPYQDG